MIPLAQAWLAGAVGYWAIIAIVIVAILVIFFAVVDVEKIPPKIRTIGMVVVVAIIAVLAIKFLLSVV